MDEQTTQKQYAATTSLKLEGAKEFGEAYCFWVVHPSIKITEVVEYIEVYERPLSNCMALLANLNTYSWYMSRRHISS